MNAVEIEEAVSQLARQPFDADAFAFDFLAAFGNKDTTLKRLRKGAHGGGSNASDLPGGVLQRNHIHLKTCASGTVGDTLKALRDSPKTTAAKAKFILATDGDVLEAEDLVSGETIASPFADFARHFGFFLPLAGISVVKEIKNNAIDVRATGRLNKLYIELLADNDNAAWGTAARRHDLNHFMARLIFCFFAEDTDIFNGEGLFTHTVEQMSANDSSNTHDVISEIFRAMNTKIAERAAQKLPGWADAFPYVNGGLFSGSTEVPRFSRMARSYLLRAGELKWREINPDIFGSMIQAVADDEERGALGMHYTSVPNILKVLNPLFLDDLRAQLTEAADNKAKLLNLRKRMAKIRVFDPACGSGNFLVIAYKEMRAIEAEVNLRRGEQDLHTDIPITNFRGIELRDFPAEIARLALIIAEYQCDVRYRGQKEALAEFLPLDTQNWITCGNALRLDWLGVCPPTGSTVKLVSDDLFQTPLEQAQIDFENEGGETFICGNPPYKGASLQSDEQKSDLRAVFEDLTDGWKSLDYVAGWFMKAAQYGTKSCAVAAFVSTNPICQGQQVPILWPSILATGHEIAFAHSSFKWANLASHNAGVTVVIVGIAARTGRARRLFSTTGDASVVLKEVANINAYLAPFENVYVANCSVPRSSLTPMDYGSKPADGGHLVLSPSERLALGSEPALVELIRPYIGSDEFIEGKRRYCLWIEHDQLDMALRYPEVARRIEAVREFRANSKKRPTQIAADSAHAFVEARHKRLHDGTSVLVVPIHTSEARDFLPVGFLQPETVVSNAAFTLSDAPLWNMALLASRLHLAWIAAVCGKLETRYRYSNTLGWNTFPVPPLTEQNKADLTRCAENILLAREAHFPATIAELYDPDAMPDNLRRAHEANDETLERIYIGRRFKNDTERLEKLFDLYTQMTHKPTAPTTQATGTAKRKRA